MITVDDYSRYGSEFPLKNKSDWYKCFKLFQSKVENFHNKKIKVVQTDNAMEFCSKRFENFLAKISISVQRTNTYYPKPSYSKVIEYLV